MKDQTLTIGKGQSSDIQVGGRYTEQVHATLTFQDGIATIEDHNTRFGTFVNGKRIVEITILNASDKLKIGTQLLDWKSYTDGLEAVAHDPNPIYFKDLFTYRGKISKSNYRFILLFTAIAPLLIFLGVPSLLTIISRMRRRVVLDLNFLIEPLWWITGIAVAYIFLMQTIKRYNTSLKD